MVEQSIAQGESRTGNGSLESDPEIERLFDEGEYDAVRMRLSSWLEDPALKSGAHYWLARIADQEDDIGDALRQLDIAFRLDSQNRVIAAKYIDMMYVIGATRRALRFYRDLPDSVAKSAEIQIEMFWIYRNARWHGLARK